MMSPGVKFQILLDCSMPKKNIYTCFVVLGLLLILFTPTDARQSGGGISGQINFIVINPPDKYAGTANGVYVSAKEGNDWKQINNGLTITNVCTLQIIDSSSRLAAIEIGISILKIDSEKAHLCIRRDLFMIHIQPFPLSSSINAVAAQQEVVFFC